jgi:transposase
MVAAMAEVSPGKLQAVLDRVETLEVKLAAAEAEIARKDQIIAALQRRLFGKSSERLDPNQEHFDFGEETLGKPGPPSPNGEGGKDKGRNKSAPKRNRSKKADLFPENLAVVIAATIVPEEVAANPEAWRKIGEEHHDELEAVPPELYWRRTVLEKYVSVGDRSRPPLLPPAPRPSIPGTLCGPDLIAMIVADKYCDHLPHYRQSQRFLRRYGAVLCRQTINEWTHAAAGYLKPIMEAIKEEIRNAGVLQIDETPADYLIPGMGEAAKGYLWYCRDAVTGTVYCDWKLSRGHECLLDILGYDEQSGTILFSGFIQCDGHSAYTALAARFEGIRLGGCLAHIRRKFYEACEQAPEVVMPILLLIQRIYLYERGLRQANAPPDCRLLVRRGHERELVEKLKKKILEEREKHLPRSKLGEAITYALNQWKEFIRYLDDGRVEIDQNLVENAIRPAKLGLKNYLFFGNAEAGENSAVLYTLMANCQVQGIDPERYLSEVIRRMPSDPTNEQAAELTPAKLAEEIRRQQPMPKATVAAGGRAAA